MPLDFETSLSASVRYFHQLVEQPLLDCLNGGQIVLAEEEYSNVARVLDINAGIDALHVHPVYGVTGLALRIQVDKNYGTFTIRRKRASRSKTEYEKRAYSLVNGGLYPLLTVQCYVNPAEGILLGGAVARTQDIFACIEQGQYRLLKTGRNQIGQASFYAVDWADVANLKTAKPYSWCPVFDGNGQLPNSCI
ncbi:hypothetical protein FACS1894214_4050 [Planctomycetales bacterium]|nr:hypothetical protein FACS1894214_4050 [Planctomycetales bacterium]